ncbi:ATP-binding protein [Caballeronia sp. LP006]|uniref:sensor histidine kinase n=1 Tax=Caballeronia sp. LP006 TaxID=3038552 RepID=UPI0028574079|nr:ATP-binding protein [Caballeronia sp. LP006]MDR5828376.1 ATP-binding protein [Caballeronia sp. LP006]
MAIVHATAAFAAALMGLTLAPFGKRAPARDIRVARASLSLRFSSLFSVPPFKRHAHGAASQAIAVPASIEPNSSLRDTLECLPLAILILQADGRIEFVNGSAEKLLGYARCELIGELAELVVPGLQMASLQQPDDIGTTVAQLFARRKDGTQFLADVALNAMHGSDACLTLAVVIDRTDRYELQRNRQELAHMTRVSMLGELAASLAHELNQPLTAILSNAQAAQRFMSREPIDLDEMREILRDLVADNNRASEILRRIRALVKKGELEVAPLSMAGVIGDVALLVHSDAIVRGIRVVLDLAPDLPQIQGDKIQLQQVVLNLLLNAFDAMNDCTGKRVVTVSAARDGDAWLQVTVRDEGEGLPAAFTDELFKPFHTSKRDGLGLGLSISRTIVEMHGGRIWAESNSGHGAAFHFRLPIRDHVRTAP